MGEHREYRFNWLQGLAKSTTSTVAKSEDEARENARKFCHKNGGQFGGLVTATNPPWKPDKPKDKA